MRPDAREMTEISADELHDLREAARQLRALEAAGVDNWSGYDDTMNELYGGELP